VRSLTVKTFYHLNVFKFMPKVLLLQKGLLFPLPKKLQPILPFVMRLSLCTALVLTMSISLFAASAASGQNISETMVSYEVHGADLTSSLNKLQDQSGFSIFYSSNLLDKNKRVNIPAGNRSVAQTLDLILKGTNLMYVSKGNKIILQEKKADETPAAIIFSGMVKDENGTPIPGVTIRLKNGTTHTATDANGHFSIEVTGGDDILIFSYIGYVTREVNIKGQSSMAITLKQTYSNLNEVQVIGYGNTTRRANTGAVSSIKASEIAVQTVSNPLTALQGHIAGMQITQDNGLPGGGVRVQIRGNASIQGGYLPLYVIDGVPFTLYNGGAPPTDALNAYGTSGASGNISPFSMINPEDIERIDVLKDADATAIYGSKGANGVVLITTKKGAQGNTKLNVNVYEGVSDVNHFIPMMNTQQYLAMRKDAFANAGTTPTTTSDKDLTVWDQNRYTDWQKWAIGGTAHSTSGSAAVSGGNAQNTYMYSTNYRKEGTVFPGSFTTTTFSNRLQAAHTSQNNRFNINTTVNYTYMNSNLPKLDLSTIYNLAPNFNPHNADGSLNWDIQPTNPYAYLLQKYSGQTTNFIGNMTLRYNILKDLAVKANLGYTLTSLHQQNVRPARSINSTATTDNSLTDATNKNDNYIVEPMAEYNKKIGDGHLTLVGGATFQQTKATGVSLLGTGFSSESLMTAIGAAGTVKVSYNNYSLYKYAAGFGRLNFSWKEKYFVDGTFRRDGSSRFGANYQFGNFGALGASWIFSEEDFMKDITAVSFGKLRASYGVTGNDQIQNYQYLPLYATASSSYAYLGTSAMLPNGVPNPNLKWEASKKLDIALELGFLKDRITLKTDFYQNRTSDLLGYISVPDQTGVNAYTGNLPGTIQNKGWEFELNTTNINKAVQWNTSFNLTFNQNKLVAFAGLANSPYYSTTYQIGKSIDAPLLYHFTGVDAQTGAPVIADVNKDGAISSTDRHSAPLGTPYYGGITNTISYKGFALDFTFQFNHRNYYLNNTLASYFYPYGYDLTNQSTAILDRWEKPGDVAKYPAATKVYSANYYNYTVSDANWGNASYIKFKTLSLTYSLPKQWLSKAKIANASIYARGQNLFTWAKQKYTYDPETNQPGAAPGLGTGQYIAFPQLRTLTLGLNLTL
jgi:TonB-linked SusC/RagA family outer membrane protein